MKGKIQKWGNSLALRIPLNLAKQAGLKEGSVVDVVGTPEQVVIKKPRESLEDMIKKITPENRHEELDWGPPVGKEVW
jgi:antitoxin MazE